MTIVEIVLIALLIVFVWSELRTKKAFDLCRAQLVEHHALALEERKIRLVTDKNFFTAREAYEKIIAHALFEKEKLLKEAYKK